MSSVNTVFLLPPMLSVDCGQAFFLLLVSRFHLYLVLAHARLLLHQRLVIREQRCALAVALADRRRSCIRKRVQAQLPVLRQRSQHLEVAQLSRIRSNALVGQPKLVTQEGQSYQLFSPNRAHLKQVLHEHVAPKSSMHEAINSTISTLLMS